GWPGGVTACAGDARGEHRLHARGPGRALRPARRRVDARRGGRAGRRGDRHDGAVGCCGAWVGGCGLMANWILHEGEALAWLRSLPDASADALITDPPYSSGGTFRGDRSASSGDKYVGNKTRID